MASSISPRSYFGGAYPTDLVSNATEPLLAAVRAAAKAAPRPGGRRCRVRVHAHPPEQSRALTAAVVWQPNTPQTHHVLHDTPLPTRADTRIGVR